MNTSATNITGHIQENPGLLNSHQWAYKKNHSTEQLLLHMVEKWRKAADENKVIGIVFIDFKKAFDSIPHKQLLFKLQRSGLSGNLLEWIRSYLTNRLQYTKIGKENLSNRKIEKLSPEATDKENLGRV